MVLFNSSLREIQNSETQKKKYGSMVKRLRHRPFTAVTGVQIPLESLKNKKCDFWYGLITTFGV